MEIPHNYTAEESRGKLEKFTEALPKDQVSDLEQSWSGDTLTFSFKTTQRGTTMRMNVHPPKK